MPDNKWEKLETELVKDFWGKSEACHIFAGLIRVVRRDSIKPSLQIVEEKQTIRAKEREQDRIKEVWDGTDHQPKGREIRSNGFTEEYSVAYCIRWAQKKRINIPWLNWAIKEGYFKAEDLEPENIQVEEVEEVARTMIKASKLKTGYFEELERWMGTAPNKMTAKPFIKYLAEDFAAQDRANVVEICPRFRFIKYENANGAEKEVGLVQIGKAIKNRK